MDASDDPDDDHAEEDAADQQSDGSVDPWAAGDSADDWVEEASKATDGTHGADGTDAADGTGSADATGTSDATGARSAGSGGEAGSSVPEPDAAANLDTAEAAILGPRRYRVLDREDDAIVLVDLDVPDPGPGPAPNEGFEPVRVAADADGDLADADAVVDLDPGHVIEATLRWPDTDSDPATGDDSPGSSPLARFDSLSVERRSRYLFADGVETLFEAARDAWQDARAAGEGMGSRVTHDTDGEPNGALYVFAEAGARDLLGEFRTGTTPLEPLVERVNDDIANDDPREVFVLRPADGAFVVVYIAFEKDGLLARTVRDTYF